MPPAYVKPYVKRQKNDTTDAEAICEAVTRANMRFVATKTPEQQSCLMLHRTRHLFIRQQTAVARESKRVFPASVTDRLCITSFGALAAFEILFRCRLILVCYLGGYQRALPGALRSTINFTPCQYRPGNPRRFVGERH